MPNVAPGAAEEIKRDILDRLVDQQVAKQRAVAAKLDRTPAVLQALEAARDEILSRAYLDRIVADTPKPTPAEVKAYYTEHPELFAQRRVFILEEIMLVSKEPATAAGLREQAAKARSMQEIADWLHSIGAGFVPNRGVRGAEQVSLEILSKVQSMRDGEIRVFDLGGGSLHVIRMVSSKLEPIDEATAGARIRQFLFNRRSNEAIAAEMKQAKKSAKIEYLGEFAGGTAAVEERARAVEAEVKAKNAAEAKTKAEAEAKERAAALSKARVAAETQARIDAQDKAKVAPSKSVQLPQKSIDKGVGGLR
jgi:EpsD family peptidyl-prolyl cis-trans isomerase